MAEKKEEEKEKEEKISHMCESIGHRSLWGHCPKGQILGLRGQISGLMGQVSGLRLLMGG